MVSSVEISHQKNIQWFPCWTALCHMARGQQFCYGSVLPTSLTYFALSTRGYKPWRPDAVMGTTRGVNKSVQNGFSRAVENAPDTNQVAMSMQSRFESNHVHKYLQHMFFVYIYIYIHTYIFISRVTYAIYRMNNSNNNNEFNKNNSDNSNSDNLYIHTIDIYR